MSRSIDSTTPEIPTAPRSVGVTSSSRTALRGGLREVSTLAYPVILTQISIVTMQLVDSAMVGRLGSTELAAVGFGGIWMWTFMCFFIGTATSVQTFVSQHHGANEAERCGGWAWQGLYAVVPLTAVASIFLLLGGEYLIGWLRPSEELAPLASDYIRARSLGNVGLAGAVVLSSFFRGIGDTKTPLYATLIANGINAVLDYGLIFGELGLPQLGVLGAGIATSIAEWVYLIALCIAFRRPAVAALYRTARVVGARLEMRRLLRLGVPIGGQWWLEMTSFAAFSTLVARMGDVEMAASQAFIVLLSISFMQAIGLSIAVSTLVGRYLGAGDIASAERSFRSGIVLCLGLGGLIALLFVALPTQLLGIFTKDPMVLALGGPLLMVGAAFQVFDALAILADGALRGAGDTRWPMLARFALAWGLFLPLSYLFGFHLGGGLTWAWVGGLVYILILAGTLVWRFHSGTWQTLKI
jgi:MATE family multidrug resistance protein